MLVNILARRKISSHNASTKNLVWSVLWPLYPCRSFQRAQFIMLPRMRKLTSRPFTMISNYFVYHDRWDFKVGELVSFQLTSFIIMPFCMAEGYIAKRCLKYLQFSSVLPDEYFNSFSTAFTSEIEQMISAIWSVLSPTCFFLGVKFVG